MSRTNRNPAKTQSGTKAAAKAAPTNTKTVSMRDQANTVLEESKGKFEGVLVIGVTDTGQLDVNSNVTQYPWLQYVLQRAGFELLIHEKNQTAANVAAEVAAESVAQ